LALTFLCSFEFGTLGCETSFVVLGFARGFSLTALLLLLLHLALSDLLLKSTEPGSLGLLLFLELILVRLGLDPSIGLVQNYQYRRSN
jgi:hypothetical protein